MIFFNFQYLIIKDFILVLFTICFLLSIISNTLHFLYKQTLFSLFFSIFLLIISIYSSKSNMLRYVYLLTNQNKEQYENKNKRHIFNDILFLIFMISYFKDHFLLKYYIIFLNLLSITNLVYKNYKKKQVNENREIELDELDFFPDPELSDGEISELTDYEP